MNDLTKIKKIKKILKYVRDLSSGKSTQRSNRLANLLVGEQFKRAKRLGLYNKSISIKEFDTLFYNEIL